MGYYSKLPCDQCHIYSQCRFQWLDDQDLPCVFCSQRCLKVYVDWQLATKRAAQLKDKTEQDRTRQNAKHRKV
jgi:hypothetical protein